MYCINVYCYVCVCISMCIFYCFEQYLCLLAIRKVIMILFQFYICFPKKIIHKNVVEYKFGLLFLLSN